MSANLIGAAEVAVAWLRSHGVTSASQRLPWVKKWPESTFATVDVLSDAVDLYSLERTTSFGVTVHGTPTSGMAAADVCSALVWRVVLGADAVAGPVTTSSGVAVVTEADVADGAIRLPGDEQELPRWRVVLRLFWSPRDPVEL